MAGPRAEDIARANILAMKSEESAIPKDQGDVEGALQSYDEVVRLFGGSDSSAQAKMIRAMTILMTLLTLLISI